MNQNKQHDGITITLSGPAGCGKSRLVQALLIPILTGEGFNVSLREDDVGEGKPFPAKRAPTLKGIRRDIKLVTTNKIVEGAR